ANQFEVRSSPDGQTALLTPGQAALAWLVGDPRAKYDVAHWVPVIAGTSSGIIVGRPGALAPDGHPRIAAVTPAGFELAALLGIYLLGVHLEPVLGLVEPETIRDAFVRRVVDIVLVHGHRAPEQVAALQAAGAQPLFTLGTLDDSGRSVRDPNYPDIPHFA